MTVHRVRLRTGIRTIGYDAAGQYETENTFTEYEPATEYDALAARCAELEALLRNPYGPSVDEWQARVRAALRVTDNGAAAQVTLTGESWQCPICDGRGPSGHAADCRLADSADDD